MYGQDEDLLLLDLPEILQGSTHIVTALRAGFRPTSYLQAFPQAQSVH